MRCEKIEPIVLLASSFAATENCLSLRSDNCEQQTGIRYANVYEY